MSRTSVNVTFSIAAVMAMTSSPAHTQAPDTCNRAAMDGVIGQTSFFVTNVIYDIAAYAPEQIVRFLRPGDDPGPTRANRLTVVFDADGRATRAYCG